MRLGALPFVNFWDTKQALQQTTKEFFEMVLKDVMVSKQISSDPNEKFDMEICVLSIDNQILLLCKRAGITLQSTFGSQCVRQTFRLEEAALSLTNFYSDSMRAAMVTAQNGICICIWADESTFRLKMKMEVGESDQIVVTRMEQIGMLRLSSILWTEFTLESCWKKSEFTVEELEEIADGLALYFQSLRYTLPIQIGVCFSFELLDPPISVVFEEEMQTPIHRFQKDFAIEIEDILYKEIRHDDFRVNCLACMCPPKAFISEFDVTLLKFGDHKPLLHTDECTLCGVSSAISHKSLWQRYGLVCEANSKSKSLVKQFHVKPQCRVTFSRNLDEKQRGHLIVAIDVSTVSKDSCGLGSQLRFRDCWKSALDQAYTNPVKECVASILQQLIEAGHMQTSRQIRQNIVLQEFIPLISEAVTTISRIANEDTEYEWNGQPIIDSETLTRELQNLILNI
uniref:Uncharacterized protein AlNc14C384G11248 n=1 Tax=Albugo laibachii Nc14 TaxID=890382 RepID=F0WYI6_9STRA|nr:conserved hypothetical protein [Albugo laibachii Nc14]|eukprot:CCA26543.1 conserved hypothetical protein [Albugo laibachii Nc14]